MSLQAGYIPVASAQLNGTVTITATSSPGTPIIQVGVPPTPALALSVEITDVDFYNPNTFVATVVLQIFVSGFGLSQPIYAPLGHTANAGVVQVPANGGLLLGCITWHLPQGGAGVDLSRGGTVGLAAYTK